MSDFAIKVENLSKSYKLYDSPVDRLKESLHPFRKKYHKDFYALKDVSFEVNKGETVGIIGKNGSGKSTLLKLITGVLTPTVGNVAVNGRISALLELGGGFNPELTGIENVYFNSTLMGYAKEEIDAKLDDILSFADIGDFVHQPVKTYSSGMFVRLVFAVAINVDPEILIVDEALAVGDIAFQSKCYRKFNAFRESGKTILFVTHGTDSVIRYCNMAIVLNNGIKVAEEHPKKAIDIYKKLMVNCYGDLESEKTAENEVERCEIAVFKENFNENPNKLTYGNMKAEIIDFGIFDKYNLPTQHLLNNQHFSIKMRVKFNERIDSPIFAYTIKDLKGTEISGTNSSYKHVDTGVCEKGNTVCVEFFQTLNLQSGPYALSLGCTSFVRDEIVVYHRLYDILLFEVISDTSMVGYYDLGSSIKLSK